MSRYDFSDENRPVMWLRGYPLYAAHVIVLVLVGSMLATTASMVFRGYQLLSALTFESRSVLSGEVWRIITYGLVNPITTSASAWSFVIDMLMIAWFGRELEKTFGRRTFLTLYGTLYLLSPLLLTVIGFWRPTQMVGQTGGFALFIAFAALYPNVALFFNILAKWVAAVLVAMYTLIALSNRDIVSLVTLWTTAGYAFMFVRVQQGVWSLPSVVGKRSEEEEAEIIQFEPQKVSSAKARTESSWAEIDALLDKIAQSGMGSLTAKERAKLEAARADLIKRESERR